MKKRGKIFFILVLCIILFSLAACNPGDTKQNIYFIYSANENSNDELRGSLIQCLEKEKIGYKVDSEKNVLIKKNDNEKATAKCS